MSFAIPPKTKLTLQEAMSKPWEDRYPNKCPLLLNIVGRAFVFTPFFLI
ncbi:hypothetical protein [Vibrio parahaemolyticus]|nr:hypothetical protein [Vibrio parahaemolyticus]MCC3834820.1 hypothetical protein [Vibrio parahaemolyticus]